ncbi:MAG: hypothetical protein QOJ92_2258 [Frankiales bacterium]|jgi:signal transduction histidine kinase|nr:hypothetical protein [Frankiales bacterium]MDX6275048.1 hypothetical protein [Frankiales bacterium]
MAAPGATSLRSRVRRAVLGTVTMALVVFALPLAVAVAFVVRANAITTLQRDATAAAAEVPDNTVEPGGVVDAPEPRGSSRIAVYALTGERVAGAGPTRSSLARAAADGQEHNGDEGGQLAVAQPILSDGTAVGAVRAGLPLSSLAGRVLVLWAGLLLLAGLTLALARVVAGRAASRIATPVERMTVAARSLGDGAVELALPVWGLREADEAGAALQETARRLGDVVRRERAFTRDVSHQLRTPLAGLLSSIEAGLQAPDDVARRQALEVSAERGRQLQTTIDDLLVVRRSPTDHASCDAVQVAQQVIDVARSALPAGRDLQLRSGEVSNVGARDAVVRQALEVLVDNAIRHGSGTITVTVEQLDEVVLLEVEDEGEGFAAAALPGTGLRLAADLAESAFGSLLVRRRSPRPRVALLLPADQSSS